MSIGGVLSRCLTLRRVVTATAVLALSAVSAGASWGAPTPPAPSYDPSTDAYSLLNITAGTGAQAWWNAGYTGKGIDVAVIDTGVSPVPGLNAPARSSTAPTSRSSRRTPNLAQPDTYGHGTFMAGLIAGPRLDADRAVRERAGDRLPGDRARRADRLGEGRHGRRRHRRHAGDRRDRLGRPARARPRHQHPGDQPLVRHQLDAGLPGDPLAYATEKAWKQGIVVVAAAGNDRLPEGRRRGRHGRSGLRPVRDRGRGRTTRWARARRATTWSATTPPRVRMRRAASTPTSRRPARTCRASASPDRSSTRPIRKACSARPYFRGTGTSRRRLSLGCSCARPAEVPQPDPGSGEAVLRRERGAHARRERLAGGYG